MQPISRRDALTGIAAAALTPILPHRPARAQADETGAFYRNQTVSLLVGYDPGGVYDISARVVARHLGRFIPGNPTIIVQNMPGASISIAKQFLSNSRFQDGLTIALFDRVLPQLAIQKHPNVDLDPLALAWLGSLSSYQQDAYLLLINSSHPAQSVSDLEGLDRPLVLGGGNAGSSNQVFAVLARDILDLNVEVVTGYSGAAPMFLAMQQGEIDGQAVGYSATLSGQRSLWDAGLVRPLVQFGRSERLPALADVPTGRELAADDEQRALIEFAELPFFMAMPFAAPSGVPEARLGSLRTAFLAMAADAEFRAESTRLALEQSPIDGSAIIELLQRAVRTPPDVIARYNELTGVPT